MAMKVWNMTGADLRQNGLSMINVCKGRNWGKYGFLTKPLIYYDYIRSLPKVSRKGTKHLISVFFGMYDDRNPRVQGGGVYIILMDSDTFWGTDSVAKIWNRFDCARHGKSVVVSTEMSCWIGKFT